MRTIHGRMRFVAVAPLLALVVLAGGGWREARGAPVPGNTLVIGTSVELKTLDQGAGSIPEITVGENIFETLLTRKLDGSIAPTSRRTGRSARGMG